eukprot:2566479-Rhodomonas_salina.1
MTVWRCGAQAASLARRSGPKHQVPLRGSPTRTPQPDAHTPNPQTKRLHPHRQRRARADAHAGWPG